MHPFVQMEEPAFHPCTARLPRDLKPLSELSIDDQCMRRFLERYSVVGYSDTGEVIIYKRRDEYIAVKPISYTSHNLEPTPKEEELMRRRANNELAVSCAVNGLRKHSICFMQTYGWLLCAENNNNMKTLNLFMEYVPLNSKEIINMNLKLDVLIGLCFLLLHAIYVGRRYAGFVHGDLHDGNVMYVQSKTATATIVHFEDEEEDIEVITNGLIPRLIDFGQSKIDAYPADPSQSKRYANISDVKEVFYVASSWSDDMYSHTKQYNDESMQQAKKSVDANDWQTVHKLLMTHPIFDRIRSPMRRKHQKLERCVSCGAAATLAWDVRPHLTFCGTECGNQCAGLVKGGFI